MLLACKDINKMFGTNTVLDKISFTLDEKEKLAIIGVNGAGKTTLFKILTNQISCDSGEIVFPKECSMGYLAQVDSLNDSNTIFEELLSVYSHLIDMEIDIRNMENCMSGLHGEELKQLMSKYDRVSAQFEMLNGYEYKSRIRGVIKGLGFADENSSQLIKTFSGGQKTRISLAKLLLTQPDLLLLDEPTNHLDIESIQWLEDYLKNYPKSVIIISHDRYFLNKIVTKIVELENGKSQTYNGNYTFYAHKKEIDREIQLKHYVNQQKEIKRQEEVIQKLKSYNREKSIKRAESREKLLDKMEKTDKPESLPDTMKIILSPRKESGNDVLFIDNISKYFDGQMLFEKVTFQIKKGERIALIGANGIGKTTLLKIITNVHTADAGNVRFGSSVEAGYYDQEHENICKDKNIFQEISEAYPKLTSGEIRQVLATFVFTGDNVFKQIDTLSGGERGRVSLAKIMLSNANFLIMDEPTNHLDIYSKEILEDALRNYTGTVLYISHDRYFINNTAQKIIQLTPNGVNTFLGNYDYYMEKNNNTTEVGEQENEKEALMDNKADWLKKKETVANERRIKTLIKKIEYEIEKAEDDLAITLEKLKLKEIYTDPYASNEIYENKVSIEKMLHELYEKWNEAMEKL